MNNPETPAGMIYARPKKVIYLHWFNAACWFILTFSGLGIIRGDMRFMPAGYAEWFQNLVGGQFNLITGHSILGLIWVAVFALFTLFNWHSIVWPFLKKVISITPANIIDDLISMVVGIANLFGLMKNVKLPPAGRYNGAQRLLGTMIILSSLGVAATGTIMFVLFLLTPYFVPGVVFQWSLVAHGFLVGLVWFGLVAHIYYSVIEEPEALYGMRTGYLDKRYVKHHCPGWYAELERDGKV
jgi:formate dehydrogenase subunit gamma